MQIEFSTTEHFEAQKRLAHEDFAFLNEEAKAYILKHLGKIRVQDPALYSPARLSMTDAEHYNELNRLLGRS